MHDADLTADFLARPCKLETGCWASMDIMYDRAGCYIRISISATNVCLACCGRWETGYWGSMDIMHDRAGYYICWGCLVWVPSVYTSPAMFLTQHPVHLGTPLALAVFAAGAAAIYVNWDSDHQRQVGAQAVLSSCFVLMPCQDLARCSRWRCLPPPPRFTSTGIRTSSDRCAPSLCRSALFLCRGGRLIALAVLRSQCPQQCHIIGTRPSGTWPSGTQKESACLLAQPPLPPPQSHHTTRMLPAGVPGDGRQGAGVGREAAQGDGALHHRGWRLQVVPPAGLRSARSTSWHLEECNLCMLSVEEQLHHL